MSGQVPTLQGLAAAYNTMQAQLNESNGFISMLKKELDDTKSKLVQANFQLNSQNAATASAPPHLLPKLNLPENFTGAGKESVLSLTTHMSNYLCNVQEPQAITIAVSYLQGRHTNGGSSIRTQKMEKIYQPGFS